MHSLNHKYAQLRGFLRKLGSGVIAFSGGLDSAVLAKVAFDCLGRKTMAVTAESPTYKNIELMRAKNLAKQIGIKHIIIKTQEFRNRKFINNPSDRCYWCKRELFAKLLRICRKYQLKYILDGTNYDDAKDVRPGFLANREFKVVSPLYECKFNKEDLRQLAKKLNFSCLVKPQEACLASRIPFGEAITRERLKKIEAAEKILHDFLGEGIILRARDHCGILRIETEKKAWTGLVKIDINRLIVKLKKFGYKYITLDLEGYIPAGLHT
jgi:uncharacterized protein